MSPFRSIRVVLYLMFFPAGGYLSRRSRSQSCQSAEFPTHIATLHICPHRTLVKPTLPSSPDRQANRTEQGAIYNDITLKPGNGVLTDSLCMRRNATGSNVAENAVGRYCHTGVLIPSLDEGVPSCFRLRLFFRKYRAITCPRICNYDRKTCGTWNVQKYNILLCILLLLLL